MKLSADAATRLLEKAAEAGHDAPDPMWIARIEKFSELCAEGSASTHVAFLGTAILAKSVDPTVDLFAIKPKHSPDNPKAYSARTLCHSVLVPMAAELKMSIGVTGREPLNNQPYFRMTKLGDSTPVHPGGRMAFDYMIELVHQLQKSDSNEARRALRAFVQVRRRYQPVYKSSYGDVSLTARTLPLAAGALILQDSEGGRRAQAVVAGIFDVAFGVERVESGRINDPSRKYPGDVCIRSNCSAFQKAIEVRDKSVSMSDAYIFGKKCIDMGILDAAIVMTSSTQEALDEDRLFEWAENFGLGLTLFYGLSDLIEQTLFWSPSPKPLAAVDAVHRIEARLIAVEASQQAVEFWQRLARTSMVNSTTDEITSKL